MAEFRRGVRLAIDWGKARVGVAACDADAVLCYPVKTVPNGGQTLVQLAKIVSEYEPIEVILGWPVNLQGQDGPAAAAMHEVATSIANQLGLDVRLVDERMSTAAAARKLSASGHSSRQRRGIIDQAAAVAILEQAVDFEKRTGTPAGRILGEPGCSQTRLETMT